MISIPQPASRGLSVDHRQATDAAWLEAASVSAIWYVAPGQVELRREVAPSPRRGEVRIETVWSAISRGTERLVFEGQVPPGLYDRMRAPGQEGDFPFPVKYGYCLVGRISEPDRGESGFVFALLPHQDRFCADPATLCPIPPAIPPRRAILAANMETALNALWDSGAGPGDRIAIVGAGVVGLLVAFLASRIVGCDVSVIDIAAERAGIAEAFGATFMKPDETPLGEADVVVHASASQEGLALALSLAGDEARVVELSWYGTRTVAAPLGLDFHVKRLSLVSSQVGQVASSRRPRWSFARRMEKAMSLLADPCLDTLITEEIAFDDLAGAMPRLLAAGAPGLCTAVRYAP